MPHLTEKFVYTRGERSKVLQQIRQEMACFGSIIMLVGDLGSGRSTVLELIGQGLDPDTESCLIRADDTRLLTEEALFELLAEGFGLEKKDLELFEDLKKRVEHFFQARQQSGQSLYIFVDDAQYCSPAVLGVLSALTVHYQRLGLLLAGSLNLPQLVGSAGEKKSFSRIELQPLSAEDIADYVQCFLGASGVTKRFFLDTEKLDSLRSITQGNMARLAQEAQKMLPSHNPSRKPDSSLMRRCLVAAIVVAVLACLWYWHSMVKTESVKKVSIEKQLVKNDKEQIDGGSGTDSATADTTDISTVEETGSEENESDDAEADQREDTASITPADRPEAAVYTRMEQDLLAASAHAFTVQAGSFVTEEAATGFLRQCPEVERSQLRYYRREASTGTAYVIVYGEYANKQAAQDAQRGLSGILARSSPWPRQMADIQAELKRRNP